MQGIFTIADFSVLDFELWAFVLIRISFMVILLPIIGTKQVPARVKAGLIIALSILIYSVIPENSVELPTNIPDFFLLALRELFVAIVMGFSASLMFVGVNIAGRIVGQSTGFAMIQSINPLTEDNESVMAQIQVIFFSLMLVVTGGHLFFIRIIAESFEVIPLLKVELAYANIAQVLILLTSQAFVYGVKLAAPVLVTLLLTTTALAIIAKIMPQINVWLVGMPLKIGIGLASMAFAFPLLWEVFQKQLYTIQVHQFALMKIFGG